MKNVLLSLKRFLDPKYQNLFAEYKTDFKPRYGYGLPPHEMLYKIINSNRNTYENILSEMLNLQTNLHSIKKVNEETNSINPVYNNTFLPGLDIFGIYTIIAKYKPQTYVEVGSGNSTKVAYKSIKDNNLRTEIISIDPQPRAEIDNIATKVVKQPFEKANFNFIFTLKENDILFIDNSHRILPNSDCMVFFMEVLPKLTKGVIVHVHDIYLPYDYPQVFCDRFYSEQYGLAISILSNPKKYVPILPNYFISEDKELRSIIKPLWNHKNLDGVERHGGSFWLQICE